MVCVWVMSSGALVGCGDASHSATPKRAQTGDITLPRGVYPSSIAFDAGGMWISESSANAVAQRLRSGRSPVHHPTCNCDRNSMCLIDELGCRNGGRRMGGLHSDGRGRGS